jgi:recombination protein RecT
MPPNPQTRTPHTEVATVSKRDLITMDFAEALEVYTPNFEAELPSHIPVERFKRTIITAVNLNPDLRKADRRSLFNAAVKCAHDGLYPDGREAALVAFGTQVTYLPMIAGIRKRMRNSGEVLSATAEVVYRHDQFRYVKGENPYIEHEPPPIEQDRGEAVGAYAIIKLSNGEVLREVMTKADMEKIKSVSRSGRNGPWVTWPEEMWRKSVLRRCAKQAPSNSDLGEIMSREDEPEDHGQPHVIPPRPTREQFLTATEGDETATQDDNFAQEHEGQGQDEAVSSYNFVDPADGVAHSFDDPDEAADQMVALLKAATPEQFDALIPARDSLIAQLAEVGRDDLETELTQIGEPAPTTTEAHEVTRQAVQASKDLFTQTDAALREAAKDGLKAFQKAWLALPELQRDLVKPGRAQYEQLAREAGA